ncbi:hypothetical protein [Yeosuana marina]|uniref:hypothetical protein n=1 Tax=Yeosuana marina TaxID=1565536 RepID=UPI0030ECAEED|tara:strand:- start:925 stop:1497 length:573 start_codon:yes stop_codon:yes gene_type:complete
MRKLLVFIAVIVLMFVGCDGRSKAHKSNQEVLKEHNLYKSFSENVKFIPETYSETTIDTLLSNSYSVKIRTYTDMDVSFLSEFSKDTIQHKNYYRDIKSVINISKNNSNITSKLITKDFFSEYNATISNDIRNKIIQGIWLNQYASLIKNKVVFNVVFSTPNSKDNSCYTLTFFDNGDYLIENELEPNIV